MVKIKEAIVVEGRYDKNTLSQILDAPILETAGFGIFKDKEQMALLRRVAQVRGLIVFTDADGAGFVIRNFLKGAVPKGQIKNCYIPQLAGKEKRKAEPSAEGTLGVEGMEAELLYDLLAPFEDKDFNVKIRENPLSKTDLYIDGTLRICNGDVESFEKCAHHLDELADRYKMNITLTVSLDAEELTEALKKYI